MSKLGTAEMSQVSLSPMRPTSCCYILFFAIFVLGLPQLSSINKTNLQSGVALPEIAWANLTYKPDNFLGVDCYYLQPATVDLLTCQPLFAKLVEGGQVYTKERFRNGKQFRYGYEPCTIMLSSTTRGDRSVEISMIQIILYATEVLQTCQETSTGGANTFQGTWQVIVTRDPIERPLRNSELSED